MDPPSTSTSTLQPSVERSTSADDLAPTTGASTEPPIDPSTHKSLAARIGAKLGIGKHSSQGQGDSAFFGKGTGSAEELEQARQTRERLDNADPEEIEKLRKELRDRPVKQGVFAPAGGSMITSG